jgi:two-component system, chemotaxis family, sensor kinase CheA
MSTPVDPLEAIKVTFFQECDELLADLESNLLQVEAGDGDSETINAIFRAVHSVKGGAGAFSLGPLVRFAHVFETTLDGLRSGKIQSDQSIVAVLLRASDVLADHVNAARTGSVADETRAAELVQALEAISAGGGAPAPAPAMEIDSFKPQTVAVASFDDENFDFKPLVISLDAPSARVGWNVTMTPTATMYAKANDALHLLRELGRIGPCDVVLDSSALPSFDQMDAEGAYLTWRVRIETDADESAVREVFDFVDADCHVEVSSIDIDMQTLDVVDAPAPAVDIEALLAGIAATPDSTAPQSVASSASNPEPAAPRSEEAAASKTATAGAPAVIRVDLERIDRLVDLVGELVINQAMLAQRVGDSALARSSDISIGLEELEQLTREIQDSVMAIRAQPVKSVFQRMPRLVRETAAMTGKKVRLVMEGEGTEVDKTVIERLADPMTHMLRNAIDHGLESPERRAEAGKPEEGVVRLSAQHRSGRVVIEVSDDGGGINRARVRDIAVQRGLIAADATLSDDEIDNLIFLPGFSTASTVSDVSGRGVGMDVVRKSIQALGGRISITSQPGRGSTFTLSLPLTLAVLDGMVVAVADHTLVAPLTTIVETLQPKPADVHRLGPTGMVLAVRGSYVPLIDVGASLGWRATPIDATRSVAILVETEAGGRAALLVDAIQGQRQVVIKSLEANFQRVDGIAAATILGDGRVALILDVDAIVEARFREAQEQIAAQPLQATG